MTRPTLALLAALFVASATTAQPPLVKPTEPPKPTPPSPWTAADPLAPKPPSPFKFKLGDTKPSPFKLGDTGPAPLFPDLKPEWSTSRLSDLTKPGTPLFPPAKPTLSTGAFPEERKRVQKLTGFPGLKDDFDVVAPATGHPDFPETHTPGVKRYNCIAWTLGIKDRFVWPAKATTDLTTGKRVPQPVAVKDFDAEYAAIGLTRRKFVDTTWEVGVKKVALFGKLNDAGELVLTHGAKQEDDGTWTSKLGGEPLIRHRTAEAVAGPAYGNPVAVYAGAR